METISGMACIHFKLLMLRVHWVYCIQYSVLSRMPDRQNAEFAERTHSVGIICSDGLRTLCASTIITQFSKKHVLYAIDYSPCIHINSEPTHSTRPRSKKTEKTKTQLKSSERKKWHGVWCKVCRNISLPFHYFILLLLSIYDYFMCRVYYMSAFFSLSIFRLVSVFTSQLVLGAGAY